MMPPPPALREIATVAGDDNIENGKAPDRLRLLCGQRIGGRPAPVVANEKEPVVPELAVDETPDVARHRLLVVSRQRTRAVAEATQVRCNHRVALSQRRHD